MSWMAFRALVGVSDRARRCSGARSTWRLRLAAGLGAIAASASAQKRQRSLQCEGLDWASVVAGSVGGLVISQCITLLRERESLKRKTVEPADPREKHFARIVGPKWNGELVAYTQLPSWQSGASIPLRVLKRSERSCSWVEVKDPGKDAAHDMPSELKVMTFNIWEDQIENNGTLKECKPAWPDSVKVSPSTEPKCRMSMIASIVERERPDLIALQEVTEPLVMELLSHQAFDDYYFTSIDHVPTHTHCPSGLMLLSRWPLRESRLYPLPGSGCGNNFITASVQFVRNGNKMQLKFVTFHLESSPGAIGKRREQARRIGELCRSGDRRGEFCILSGDANIKDDPEPLHFGLDEEDAWVRAHWAEPSIHGSTRGNGVIPSNIPTGWDPNRDYRMDRIYVAGDIDVKECRVIGTDFEQITSEWPPLKGQTIKVWPSDHAGLVATVRLKV